MNFNPQVGDEIEVIFGKTILKAIVIDKHINNQFRIQLAQGDLKGHSLRINENQIISIIKTKSIESQKPLEEKSNTIQPGVKQPDAGLSNSVYQQRCWIDTLRFGLVPNDNIEELTLEFPKIQQWVLSSFPAKSPVAHQIIGPYGVGKSHIISVIHHLAQKNGYLLGSLQVDGKEVTLSLPEKFLFYLSLSLKGEDLDPGIPLFDLYLKSIKKNCEPPRITSDYLPDIDRTRRNYNLIQFLYSKGLLEEFDYLINDVLTCNVEEISATDAQKDIRERFYNPLPIRLYPVISRSPVEQRPKDFMAAIVGMTKLAQNAGYKGFIITIDEWEVEEEFAISHGLRTSKDREQQLISVFSDYFDEESEMRLPQVPLGFYFASITSHESGSEENDRIDDLIDQSGGSRYNIQPFKWNPKNDDQLRFVKRIHEIYHTSYNYKDVLLHEKLMQELTSLMKKSEITSDSGAMRRFIKRYISLLDSLYGPPSKHVK